MTPMSDIAGNKCMQKRRNAFPGQPIVAQVLI